LPDLHTKQNFISWVRTGRAAKQTGKNKAL